MSLPAIALSDIAEAERISPRGRTDYHIAGGSFIDTRTEKSGGL
jgi:hypothetical protein